MPRSTGLVVEQAVNKFSGMQFYNTLYWSNRIHSPNVQHVVYSFTYLISSHRHGLKLLYVALLIQQFNVVYIKVHSTHLLILK